MRSHTDRFPEESSEFMAELLRAINDFDRRAQSMSASELMLLPDEDFLLALEARIGREASPLAPSFSIGRLSVSQRSVYVASLFDSTVQVYGLEFFLTGENRFLTPYVADAFLEIGAVQQAGLLKRFFEKHKIDMSLFTDPEDAPSPDIPDLSAYPLSRFDEAYRQLNELSPVEPPLIAYARAHIDSL